MIVNCQLKSMVRYSRHRKKEPRQYKVSVMLNESELRAIERYCRRYKITNRSHFIRQTLLKTVIRRFTDDQPTLFD